MSEFGDKLDNCIDLGKDALIEVQRKQITSLQSQLTELDRVATAAGEFVDAVDENSPKASLYHANLVHALFEHNKDKSDELR